MDYDKHHFAINISNGIWCLEVYAFAYKNTFFLVLACAFHLPKISPSKNVIEKINFTLFEI